MQVHGLSSHRWLLYELARREILSRHAGSVSGFAWTFLQPLAQLAIFSFVFSHVFRAGVPAGYTGISYTAFVAVALWPWIMFSDGVQRGMAAVGGNASLVKKVAMPSQLFVYASVIACYVMHIAGYVVVLVALAMMGENIHLAFLPFAILLLVPYALLAGAVGLVLAALHTLLRDVEHATTLVLMVVFYASPILYPLEIVPAEWRDFLSRSPFAYLSERLREVLLSGSMLTMKDVAVTLGCVVFFAAALWMFKRLAPYFEDFL